MDKKLIEESKEKLEKTKKIIEKQLAGFAEKDDKLKGDWDSLFPLFNGQGASSGALEEATDEVEEYGNLLPVEHNLELRLKSINSALEKIKKGQYGICEKCGKKIPEERLKAFPEAKTCLSCQENKPSNK